jgi:hypothetical protein
MKAAIFGGLRSLGTLYAPFSNEPEFLLKCSLAIQVSRKGPSLPFYRRRDGIFHGHVSYSCASAYPRRHAELFL